MRRLEWNPHRAPALVDLAGVTFRFGSGTGLADLDLSVPAGSITVLGAVGRPPFLATTLSVVLRLSARVKSAAAAQQASGPVTLPLIIVSYAQSTTGLLGAGSGGVLPGLVA